MTEPAATTFAAVNENETENSSRKASEEIRNTYSKELFFALVGPVGAGSSRAAEALKRSLEAKGYTCHIFKASAGIVDWAAKKGKTDLPKGIKTISAITKMQNYGDKWRNEAKDNSVIALHCIREMMAKRAEWQNIDYRPGDSIAPDGTKRAYIVDSLKHPAEGELLRRVYGNAFTLVGVVSDEDVRRQRLTENLFVKKDWKNPQTEIAVYGFMQRDADDPENKCGQHVTDTFHMADFFVDNTQDDPEDEHQFLNEPFGRLIDIVSHQQVRRPTTAETAMHMAYSAALRSICMSRQVGAALVDRNGNIIATGTNEVPMAGGGVYGEDFREFTKDGRCISLCESPECASNKEQNEIINDLISQHPGMLDGTDKEKVVERVRKSRIGGLLEFSRAVHAEMDAILSAARSGLSPVGGRLFVTTFPCHYCARHIVASGIYEVQYIEPYPKSKALQLHADAIETRVSKWLPPDTPNIRRDELLSRARKEMLLAAPPSPGSEPPTPIQAPEIGKILFRPFVGVAPRMYPRAFLKDRDYKDKLSGKFAIREPEWGGQWGLHKLSYYELEARLGEMHPPEE